MSKSADVGQATKGCSVLPVPQSGRAEFRLHPLCQLAPARHTAGAFSRYTEDERRYELRSNCGRNVLVSIAYEFTVMSWVIAAQEHIEDKRTRR